ncbi:uncharacterized protein BO88DRAFT_344745, partial [Aspergillus vadensis CBS 113365]
KLNKLKNLLYNNYRAFFVFFFLFLILVIYINTWEFPLTALMAQAGKKMRFY